MSVAVPVYTKSATAALMSPVAEAVTSSFSTVTDSDISLPDETSDFETSVPVSTIAPIVTVFKSNNGAKRPQMKYDPEVPLSKEETSAWRREQRRKRNRESAAACRKRQRDRISELEVEVSEWKAKFDEAIRKLSEVEGSQGAYLQMRIIEKKFPERNCFTPSSSDTEDGEPLQKKQVVSHCVTFAPNMVTPTESRSKMIPPISASVEHLDFPVLKETIPIKTEFPAAIGADSFQSRVEKGQHSSEMITRPAVKITDAVPTPLAAIESVCDDLLDLVPDSIFSLTEAPLSQTAQSLIQSNDEANELDEFLLDAVTWL